MKISDFPQDIEPRVGDIIEIEQGDVCFEVRIIGITADGYLCEQDNIQGALLLEGVALDRDDVTDITGYIAEERVRLDPKCWKGKKIGNPKTKIKGGVRVNNCVPEDQQEVAESTEQSLQKKIQAKRDALGLAREQRRARGQHQQGQREIKLQAEIDKLSSQLTQMKKQDVAEAGPFSYGYKPPRKGSVAYWAEKKRKEQEKGKPPIEPKDQMVGVAKVTKAVAEGIESQYMAARYIDEFGDGDHWYVKGTPDVIKKFVLLANSLEDEAVKGTEYEPGKGMMGGVHAELGNDAAPQWTVVPARNLEAIKPIGDKVLQRLMRPNLADGAQEFMSELLWAMEEKGLALVTDDSQQGVAEGEGKTQKYEMMMRNGQVKKFVAKDDADAKRIAKGHGAKSVIRLRGGVPAGKVAEQGVAEGSDKLQGTPVVSLKDLDDKDTKKDKYGRTVPKKLQKDDPRVKFHKDEKQGVAEGYSDYKDSYEDEQELYSGCYVRDRQEGPSGEVFVMRGDPEDRRVRIEDRDGRGWYISPYRLELVDENDPAIKQYFGGISEAKSLKKRVRVVQGEHAGKTGWIREIKHGIHSTAPKRYYVDIDGGGQADNLPASALRLLKDQSDGQTGMAEGGYPSPHNYDSDEDYYAAVNRYLGKKGPRPGDDDWEETAPGDDIPGRRRHRDDDIDEAKYQGREVPLGKKMAGDVAKSKVYVRKPNGKVVKVNFGDKNMTIKKSNPKRRKSFRARHNCDNPGPRWRARYWSCRSW